MRTTLRPLAPLLLLACAMLPAACGSGATRTVTEHSPPGGGSPSRTTASTSTTATTPPAASTQSPTTPAPASTPASTTRTAPEPAFTQGQTSGSSLDAAERILSARGDSPVEASTYHQGQTLTALVGRASAGEQAFFFLGGRYIGTDASRPSASVQVVSEKEDEVTLSYGLYRSGDPEDAPSGGRAEVRFTLDDGKLEPTAAIPPASPDAALSRR